MKRIPKVWVVLLLCLAIGGGLFYRYCSTYYNELSYADIFPLPEEDILFIEARSGDGSLTEVDRSGDAYREFMDLLQDATYIRYGKGSALANCHGRISFWPDTYEKRVEILISDDGHILVSQNGGSGSRQPCYTVAEGTGRLCQLLDIMASETLLS